MIPLPWQIGSLPSIRGFDKLMVVDAQDHLRGLFTLSDVDRITHERQEQFKPARDREFRLLVVLPFQPPGRHRVIWTAKKTLHHVEALVERGVDAVAVSGSWSYPWGGGDGSHDSRCL